MEKKCKKDCNLEKKMCNTLTGRCIKPCGNVAKKLPFLKRSPIKRIKKSPIKRSPTVGKRINMRMAECKANRDCVWIVGKGCHQKSSQCLKSPIKSPFVKLSPVVLSLEKVFLTTKSRVDFMKKLKSNLKKKDKKCHVKELENVQVVKKLGEGSFGQVFLGELGPYRFAIKQAKVSKSMFKKLYSNEIEGWGEMNILLNITNPIVTKGICPNLPLVFDDFYHFECDFIGKSTKKPCTITLNEFATGGTLAQFLERSDITVEQSYSLLFQVLAGLHALQNNGIFHNDVKSLNILIYDTEIGGYYEYTILGKRYYVPNIGKIAVLNDFGVSISYPNKYHTYFKDMSKVKHTLGIRQFQIVDEKVYPLFVRRKDGSNVRSSMAVTFKGYSGRVFMPDMNTVDDKLNLFEPADVPSQYEYFSYSKNKYVSFDAKTLDNVSVFPPINFVVDILDVLRTFIGNISRCNQPGDHGPTKIPDIVKKMLVKNSIDIENKQFDSQSLKFNFKDLMASYFLAGSMIKELFGEMYKTKQVVIESYKLS